MLALAMGMVVYILPVDKIYNLPHIMQQQQQQKRRIFVYGEEHSKRVLHLAILHNTRPALAECILLVERPNSIAHLVYRTRTVVGVDDEILHLMNLCHVLLPPIADDHAAEALYLVLENTRLNFLRRVFDKYASDRCALAAAVLQAIRKRFPHYFPQSPTSSKSDAVELVFELRDTAIAENIVKLHRRASIPKRVPFVVIVGERHLPAVERRLNALPDTDVAVYSITKLKESRAAFAQHFLRTLKLPQATSEVYSALMRRDNAYTQLS